MKKCERIIRKRTRFNVFLREIKEAGKIAWLYMAEDVCSTLTDLLIFVVKETEKLAFRPFPKFFACNRGKE
jgi:hypothetical protein